MYSICQKILKAQQWPWNWKRSVFIPIPKKGNAKECSNYHTVALISHDSKEMLKILQARFNSIWPGNFQMFKLDLVKAEESEINCQHPLDHQKAREFRKNIYFCFIDCTKVFDCVDHNRMWKILLQMGMPDHLTCLLRNLYAGQEATVRIRHGTTDWFQIGKWLHQGCVLSPCLFNLYAEYIMRNAGLDEA